MKVLIANPATRESIDSKWERYFVKAGSRWPWTFRKRKSEPNYACFFPHFLAYTANILRDNGHDVHVIDGVAVDMREAEFLNRTTKIAPELVVIETTTHAINHDLELCKKIKDLVPDVKILLCGAHITEFGEPILKENAVIDFIVRGEYEFVVSELVQKLTKGDLSLEIKGLGFRMGTHVWISKEKAFIEEVNELPWPAFDLFPTNEEPNLGIYGDGICTFKPSVTLHVSRGCPYRCDFCMWNTVMYDNGKYRMFDVKRIVDEMEHVIKVYGAKEIYFDDDDFCINKKHVIALCNEIKKRKLNIPWSAMGDAMSIDEEMMKNMAEAGCIFMKFGVESGNEQVLKTIHKPLKPAKAIEVAKWGRKYGVMTHATFSFGLSGETRESMQDTLNLAKKIPFDTAQMSISTPFPGTHMYRRLVEGGHLQDTDWRNFDGTTTCTSIFENLDPKEVEAFRKKAIRAIIFKRALEPMWWKRYLKRNVVLYKNFGLKPIVQPFLNLMRL